MTISPLRKQLRIFIKRSIIFLNLKIRKRVPFNHEGVVSGWGIGGDGLANFSARLYRDVKLLKEAIGNYHGKKTIEIGAGYGRLTPWIAEHSEQHYAIEPEPSLLDVANILYPEIKFSCALVQNLPYPNNFFDLCVSWTVLQHIPPLYIKQATNEIKRVLTDKAIIILAEGVGACARDKYWERQLDEWKELFSPWKLVWYKERKIEETYKGFAGLVMRFER